MKHHTLLFSLLLVLALSGCQQPAIRPYAVVPQPDSIAYTPGIIELSNPTIAYPKALAAEAELLASYLKSDFSLTSSLSEASEKGDIQLQIDPTLLPDQPEGYLLDATSRSIILKANNRIGILHAMQTLRQAITKEEGKCTLQKALTTDYPAFSWRAFMLDEARYFKGKEVVKELLDEMALLKLNTFHWHLTNDQGWRVEIKGYPELTKVGAFRDSSEINHFHSDIYDGKPHGGFYTQDDIREIVAYASTRGITIVPEVSMPGHGSAAIASYPWLGTSKKPIRVPGKFGVHYEAYDVSNPKVMAFFDEVTTELIALFPGSVFHIGGDEVKYDQWKASSSIRAYMAKHKLSTPAELQVYFTNEVSNMLAAKGKKMMGWNEITGAKLHDYQSDNDTKEVAQQLAPGTIVHFWKGDPKLMCQAIEQGYDVVNSNHSDTYLDYTYKSIPLERSYTFNPIPEGLTEAQQRHVLGLGCQMWGEFTPTVESMNRLTYPRLAAYAEAGWTSQSKKDFARFTHALQSHLDRWAAKGIVYGVEEAK